ncbi:MAG: hypothetical protein ABJH45_01135 [Paracoccaceae bacterium]
MIPSWRFFKTIEPSPRVQWRFLPDSNAAPAGWQEFQPQPSTVAPSQMILRLFWNPDRNEELFVVSCAERIQQEPTDHSINEIKRRIQIEIVKAYSDTAMIKFQFRLVFVHREQTRLVQETVFLSDEFPVSGATVC